MLQLNKSIFPSLDFLKDTFITLQKKSILIVFTLFFAHPATAQLPAHLPAVGLIGWYPFNGNTNDESGNLNHATISSGILPATDRYGMANAAYKFIGNNTINIPPASYTPFDSSFTISFWFNSISNNRIQPFNINDGNLYTSNLNFAFNNSGSNLVFWNSQGGNNITCGSVGQYTDGFWHNLIFLREDSLVKLYLDGSLTGTALYKLPIGNNSTLFLSNGSYAWDGELDDLAIYSRALTVAEIDTLYDINNPDVLITTPIQTDAFPVGYADTINWTTNFSISKVKIEYSIDSGTTWQLIKDSVQASLRKYIWITPNLPGNKCLIKVTDIGNAAKFDISSSFLISRYKWQSVISNAPFSVRDGAGAFSYKDSMYLVGGWNPLDAITYPLITNNEVWRSFDGLSWTLISAGPWEPRHTAGSLVFNNKMWIVGGDELQNKWQRDVWSSNNGVNWTMLSDSVPWGERMTHMTCVFDNKLWVMGGQKIVGWSNVVDTVFNDVWNSTDGINWTLITQHAGWSPRAQIGGQCVFNNKMWILGGGTYNGIRKFYNDIWNSSDGANWNLIMQNAPWAPRQYHDVIVYDSAMWVVDGYDAVNGNRNDAWYSYNGTDWHNLKGTPWPPRHASSLFNHDSSLWLVAGNLWNDVWRLNNLWCSPLQVQPLDANLFNGDTATFVVASGKASSTYQWQINNFGTWQNLSNQGQFKGTTNDTLLVLSCTQANDSNRFRCIVNSGNCNDSSRVANLWIASDLGIKKNLIAQKIVSIFPNPASDFIDVKVNTAAKGTTFQILDMYGKIVSEGVIRSENFRCNTGHLTSGLYVFKVDTSTHKLFEIHR